MSNTDLLDKETLKSLNLKQLKALQDALTKSIESAKKKEISSVYKDILKMLNENNLTFDEMVEYHQKKSSNKPSIQYRHPDNPKLTWAGGGRRPQWILDWIADGRDIEDCRVDD